MIAVGKDVQGIIERICNGHPDWSAQRVQRRLARYGHVLSHTTVEKYMTSPKEKRVRYTPPHPNAHQIKVIKHICRRFPDDGTAKLMTRLAVDYGIAISHVTLVKYGGELRNKKRYRIDNERRRIIEKLAVRHPTWSAAQIQKYMARHYQMSVCLNAAYRYQEKARHDTYHAGRA